MTDGGNVIPQRRPTQCDRILAVGHDAVVTRCALLRIKRDATTPEETRFFQKVQADDNGCWNWTASISVKGYGAFRFQGRPWPAHRVLYGWFYGFDEIDGMDIDHLCRNRACVNPMHLEAVTHAENVARGRVSEIFGSRTHCSRGHEYTPENTGRRSDCGGRVCRTCARAAQARWKARA